MAITSYTFYANHPRIHCRDTDLTGGLNIRGMSNTTAQWKPTWDTYVIPYADSAIAKTDATLAGEDALDTKMFSLGLAGWVDTVTSYHNKLLSCALYMANLSPEFWPGFTQRREWIMGLAYAYDFLSTGVITFSAANKKTIGIMIQDLSSQGYGDSGSGTDFIDGHFAGNMMSQVIGAIALGHESGTGYNWTSGTDAILTTSFGYWYGLTTGAENHIESNRYYGSDGGSGKGTWYQALDGVHSMWLLNAMTMGFSAIEEDSVAYVPFANEDWVQRVGEWWLRGYRRGDGDYFSMGDCFRTYVNPFYQEEARRTLAVLIRRGGNWRKHVHWLRNQLHVQSGNAPYSIANYAMAQEVALWDPTDAAGDSEPPALASPALPKGRLFDPPGEFLYDSSFDHPNGCKISISCEEFLPTNHQHLNCGGIGIWLKNDSVLSPSTGRYTTSDVAADFGGTHHRNWHQQSIGHSGVPLVDEPGLTHTALNNASPAVRVTYPSGLGGQLWREYAAGATVALRHDPLTCTNMRNQGSKLAWRRSGINANGDNRFRVVTHSEGVFWFLHADFTHSYLKDIAHLGTTNQRVNLAEMKILIVENVSIWPIVLRLVRVTSRLATFTKRDHWHVYKAPTIGNPAPNILRASAAGLNTVGKITIDHYNSPGFTMTTVPFGSVNSQGYGSTQFSYGGNNYPPTNGANVRQEPDIGRYRVDVSPVVARQDDLFATALFPTLVLETPPAYTVTDDTNWVIWNFSGKEFRIHKSQPLAQTNADTVPPAAPTGVTAVNAAGGGTIRVGWNLNSEDDIASYKTYYRVKV